MKRISQYLLAILFLGFIIGIGVYMQFSPAKAISFYENRTLVQDFELSKETILDGTFAAKYEEYFTDQFIGRDRWVKNYLQWQRVTNQTFIYDYFIAGDDWIYPKPTYHLTFDSVDKMIPKLEALSEFILEKGMEMYYFSLPSRAVLLEPPYPYFIEPGHIKTNTDYFSKNLPGDLIPVIDMEKIFNDSFNQSELKDLYFQTDHHWNIDGAFKGYEIIYRTLNNESNNFSEPEFNQNNFKKECFSDIEFLGSYNRQLYGLIPTNDRACVYLPVNFDLETLQVYNGPVHDDKLVNWNDIYSKSLKNNNGTIDYAGLYTADHRELNIINPLKQNGAKALILKDSYTNPLTMLLSQHFYQTTFYDMRYNTNRTLYEFIEANDFDVVIFLYNNSTVNNAEAFETLFNFDLEK